MLNLLLKSALLSQAIVIEHLHTYLWRVSMLNKQRHIYTEDQVRSYEVEAAKQCGIDLFTLMQRAGESVYKQWQSFNAKLTLIIAGNGNNAGDAYIAARLIKDSGAEVKVCAIDPAKTLSGDAAKAKQLWLDNGGIVNEFAKSDLDCCDCVIDGLLGTGLNSPVRENYCEIITAINQSEKPVLSIDVPSGIDANTGEVLGAAIQATKTLTFIAIKQGLSTGTGKQHAGELILDELAIEDTFSQLASPCAHLINIDSFKRLGSRALNSHKGNHGKLLCVGGNQGTAGAIRLSSEAALRAGAGMVKVYTHQSSIMPISIGRAELMVMSENLEQALEWASCVVLGPGLGQDEWAKKTFCTVMHYCQEHNTPLVLDADALNLLAENASAYTLAQCVLTPHPGEATRLISKNTSEIESNRFGSVRLCAKRYNATCILKGAGSLIDNGKSTWVCENGNAALAVGGSGDVLTGIIGALLAQGLSIDEAARYGVTLHARAGEVAAEEQGQRGMLPSDLFQIVRSLIN